MKTQSTIILSILFILVTSTRGLAQHTLDTLVISETPVYASSCGVGEDGGFWTVVNDPGEGYYYRFKAKKYLNGSQAATYNVSSFDGMAHGFTSPKITGFHGEGIRISNRAVSDVYPACHRVIHAGPDIGYHIYYTGWSNSYYIGRLWSMGTGLVSAFSWGATNWDSDSDTLFYIHEFPVSESYIDSMVSGDTLLVIPRFDHTLYVQDARVTGTNIVGGLYSIPGNTGILFSCFDGADTLALNDTLFTGDISNYQLTATDSLICGAWTDSPSGNIHYWLYDPFINEVLDTGILYAYSNDQPALTRHFRLAMSNEVMAVQIPTLLNPGSSESSNYSGFIQATATQYENLGIDTLLVLPDSYDWISHALSANSSGFQSLVSLTAEYDSTIVLYGLRANPVSVVDAGVQTPSKSLITQAFPNPFNAEVTLVFELDQPNGVELEVFDIKGRLIRRLHTGFLGQGEHTFRWNLESHNDTHLETGVFFVALRTETNLSVRKILYLK